jgi:hypothetical protein
MGFELLTVQPVTRRYTVYAKPAPHTTSKTCTKYVTKSDVTKVKKVYNTVLRTCYVLEGIRKVTV